ncbi:MAG: hypothetical protein AB7F86_18640 [Bdellovibrionales bacterium]
MKQLMRTNLFLFLICPVLFWGSLTFASQGSTFTSQFNDEEAEDQEEYWDFFQFAPKCQKASKSQKAVIDRGNRLAQEFLAKCIASTGSEYWCQQITRPNPASLSIFQCTYGQTQIHQLINPDKNTWANAFRAVQLVQTLQNQGIKPCLIYNWWRPEPYNKNVGGAPGRHPQGTSVDVRFCSMPEMESAFSTLCSWRASGQLRALGYYGTTGLHLGVGDKVPNTWGKDCP